jgi:hypothetical protein
VACGWRWSRVGRWRRSRAIWESGTRRCASADRRAVSAGHEPRADKPPIWCLRFGPDHSGSKITSSAKQTLASGTDLGVGRRFVTERTH